MLVLTRKPGETIVIGGRITVTVVQLDGHRVRLGIDAPADVRILRGELAEWQVEAQPASQPLIVPVDPPPADPGPGPASTVRVKAAPR